MADSLASGNSPDTCVVYDTGVGGIVLTHFASNTCGVDFGNIKGIKNVIILITYGVLPNLSFSPMHSCRDDTLTLSYEV